MLYSSQELEIVNKCRYYGTREATFSFLYLSEKKLKQENQKRNSNKIIFCLNDDLCRFINLLILYKQQQVSFKRLIMSFDKKSRKGN